MHRILIPVLSNLSHDDPTKWFKHVPTVQRVINSSTSKSTKYTPFELMMGTKMKNKEDIKVNVVLHEEYLNHLMHERDERRNDAKKNILKVQEENRRNYDKKRKMHTSTGLETSLQFSEHSLGLTSSCDQNSSDLTK
ncbi:hypothetical protein AVEN_130721-1 [Araneus ventricosus]|uniref:Uncharacterized protein n=1 Tax=Araneus ventricosus TaxID=182803 RepID=A0A4Y2W5R6_ARAVE|nr:hypothetical protein AVEN_130721-1 [Araneus ventricosus]